MRNRRLLVLMTGLVFLLCAGLAFSADFKVKQRSGEQLQSEYANNEILVKFKPTAKNIPSIHATLGTMEIPVSMNADFQRLRIPATATVEEMLAAYRANPDVEYAEPNYIYHAFLVPNDPYYAYQWHMPSINVGPAWDLSTGAGVLVGVIDTGVGYENYGVYGLAPDLVGATFVAGYDFVNNDAHANDDNAHGTHVTGTIRQSTNNGLGVVGVAFNCSIMPIKVLDAGGSGYVSDIAEGITYAADHGCKVINMSLGGPTGSTTLQSACTYAYNAGVTIICAAGNAGTSTPQYPAAYTPCISVSSVRYDNTKPSYSSYGSTIDICAPGGDVGVDQNGDGYGDLIVGSPCFSNDAHGEDWKLYFEGDNGMLFYYDASSIKFLTPNIVHVWMKNFPPTEEVRLNYIQAMRKKEPTFPDNVKYTAALVEINCKSKTFTSLQVTAYSVQDEVVISETIKDPPVEIVQAESMIDTLYKVVCAKRVFKKKRQ